jgi:hypothetical protein
MKSAITIKYNSGDQATYIAQPPEYAKWEKETGKSIRAMSEPGIWDILFLAYNAMKREAAGKPVKSFDIWMDTVADIEVEGDSPKAIPTEV